MTERVGFKLLGITASPKIKWVKMLVACPGVESVLEVKTWLKVAVVAA